MNHIAGAAVNSGGELERGGVRAVPAAVPKNKALGVTSPRHASGEGKSPLRGDGRGLAAEVDGHAVLEELEHHEHDDAGDRLPVGDEGKPAVAAGALEEGEPPDLLVEEVREQRPL